MAKQARALASQCEISIKSQGFDPRSHKIFRQTAKTLSDTLIILGIVGTGFRLWPMTQVPSSPKLARRQFHSVLTEHRSIYFSYQPGSNDTAWRYRFMLPDDYSVSAEEVCAKLGNYDPNAKKGPAENVVQFPPRQTSAAETAPAAVSLPYLQVIEEIGLVALALYRAFPHLDAEIDYDAIEQELLEDQKWSAEDAVKFVQALVNRKMLKQTDRKSAGMWYAILSGQLRNQLGTLGVPASAPSPAKAKAAPKAQPEPAKDDLSQFAAQVQALKGKVQRYREAKATLDAAAKRKAEIDARRQTLTEELDALEREAGKLSREIREASLIAADPEYAKAVALAAELSKLADS